MSLHQPLKPPGPLSAVIFDVDGVLLRSPHEQAWRDALQGFADPTRFTTEMYQAEVAGKPRLDGARAALRALGVPDSDGRAEDYAERKQARLEALIRDGSVKAFPDALRFVAAIGALGWPMAVASASKNANQMMQPLKLPSGTPLLAAFAANVSGLDVKRGKPDPEIFLAAAHALAVAPDVCVVVEDAPAGIAAARAGAMAGLGVARLGDEDLLRKAKADLIVTSLDDVDIEALAVGQLSAVAA
jgi:HAD superfamily hydrolase (TIGR01509 family)